MVYHCYYIQILVKRLIDRSFAVFANQVSSACPNHCYKYCIKEKKRKNKQAQRNVFWAKLNLVKMLLLTMVSCF